MDEINRQQQLVLEIAKYLSDWLEEPEENVTSEEYIKIIESYGVGFENPSDELVINAIRHFRYVVNPWNKTALPEILMESVGFTKEECDKYFQRPA
jgi:hypothetical protein